MEKEQQFMEMAYYRTKHVQKSLLKSLSGQVSAQQVKRQGVMIEEAQLADSILYLYWKQKMAKQYYLFAKAAVIEKADQQIDEDKIEEQFSLFKIDIKYSIRDYKKPNPSDGYLNKFLQQLQKPVIGKYLDFKIFKFLFKSVLESKYFEDSRSRKSFVLRYER